MEQFKFLNKKVTLLIKAPVLGGAERQALGLAYHLINNHNCSVDLIATHSGKATEEFQNFASICGINKIHFFGIPSLSVKSELSYKNLKKFVRALKYINSVKKGVKPLSPDIIIPFLNAPSKIAVLIYKSVGAKITFWHQLGLDSYYFDKLEQYVINKTPFFIANAENGLTFFKEKYQITNDKLFVLPQFISIQKKELDKIKLREILRISNDSIVIGMIAHYREEKYQELLIEAFSKIKTVKNIHLIFLGNKNNDAYTLNKYKRLNEMVTSLDITNKVSILSEYDIHKVLNLIDIGVLVSQTEGTPNVIMEYMLYGLPVISSNHIGCARLLENSNYLIENNVDLLSNKLEFLINNKDLRIEEGKKNLELIKKYSAENYIIKLEEIINKFI